MSPRLVTSLFALAGIGLGVSIAASASAHARLLMPTPRSTRADLKGTLACGDPADNPPDAAMTTYAEGQEITISYEETIQHTGCFVGKVLENNETKATLFFNVNDPETSALNTPTTIKATLPAGLSCYKCTLQFNQVMSGTLCNGTVPDAPTYHSCATIRITYPDGGVPPMPEGGVEVPDASTTGGSTTGSTTGDDHTGMDHGSTTGTSTTGGGTKATDDGEDTQPQSALCSVGPVGAPVGFAAGLFGLVGVAFLRRRREKR